MTKNQIEQVQITAETIGYTSMVVSHNGINRFSVTIGSYVYTSLNKALSALGTVVMKDA